MANGTIDTGTDDLKATVEGGVATLTMARPERRNALSPAMLQALGKTLELCESDPAVGVVVLTGAGGAFCAGGDVKGMNERNADDGPVPDIDSRIHAQRLSQRATAG